MPRQFSNADALEQYGYLARFCANRRNGVALRSLRHPNVNSRMRLKGCRFQHRKRYVQHVRTECYEYALMSISR